MSRPVFAPPTLVPADYNIALGPLKGAEKKLKISTQPSFALGEIKLTGASAGTYVPSIADNLALADRPSSLIASLRNPVDGNGAAVVLQIMGTDQGSAVLSGRATFAPPVYAQNQDFTLPEGYGVDVVVPDGKKFMSITSVVPVGTDAKTRGCSIRIFGLPDLSTFSLVPYRVRLDYNQGVREPSPTQDGNDMSAYIKPGDRPVKTFNITGKIPSQADGIQRINGRRVTGLAYEEKEDVVVAANEYFMGLIITAKQTHPEGAAAGDDSTLDGTGMCKDYALLLAS